MAILCLESVIARGLGFSMFDVFRSDGFLNIFGISAIQCEIKANLRVLASKSYKSGNFHVAKLGKVGNL